MSEQPPNTALPGPDAKLIARVIDTGWVGRGFGLGIGFWLAGAVIGAVVWFVLTMTGVSKPL